MTDFDENMNFASEANLGDPSKGIIEGECKHCGGWISKATAYHEGDGILRMAWSCPDCGSTGSSQDS